MIILRSFFYLFPALFISVTVFAGANWVEDIGINRLYLINSTTGAQSKGVILSAEKEYQCSGSNKTNLFLIKSTNVNFDKLYTMSMTSATTRIKLKVFILQCEVLTNEVGAKHYYAIVDSAGLVYK